MKYDLEKFYKTLSRRDFLKSGLTAGTALCFSPASRLIAASEPKVIIVGAGLAGLTAAYEISKRTGIRAQIFEAQSRVGGRVRTMHASSYGISTEGGAQFVDTAHKEITNLITELGLELTDLWESKTKGKDSYFFNQKHHKWSHIKSDLEKVYARAEKHFKQINWPFTFKSANERARYWDGRSVEDWIKEYCPDGVTSQIGQYLKVYFETLYAGPIQEASAIHLITDLTSDSKKEDERYGIKGGSEALTSRLLKQLPKDSVNYGMPFLSIKSLASGRVVCTFQKDRSVTDVVADKVILALPFSVLKSLDFKNAGFESTMETGIQNLGMGKNCKINLLLQGKPWEALGFSGGFYSDLMVGTSWTVYDKKAKEGFLVCMNGGENAEKLRDELVHEKVSTKVLNSVFTNTKEILGDISVDYLGLGFLNNWPKDPWVEGSYSYYKVGGFTAFSGIEGKRQGNVYFAGEHTAPYSMHGTMNGAVYSGVSVAKKIVAEVSRGDWLEPFNRFRVG